MVYLSRFKFPSKDCEDDVLWKIKMMSVYPFKVLSNHSLEKIDFEPVTILYGGNGSGKTTALNVIAEKLKLNRSSLYNKSRFYSEYVNICKSDISREIPENSGIITSDDVFDYMLNIRSLNEGIELKREDIHNEYLNAKYSSFQMKSIEDYEQLKTTNNARRKSQTRFTKSQLMDNVRELSNGESAFKYFTEKIGENGLYILDEPENSLSPQRQMELQSFVEDSVRFFGCQFIISTHSPFLLAIPKAKIYDLDKSPVDVRQWTELENVRMYYEFFKLHDCEF